MSVKVVDYAYSPICQNLTIANAPLSKHGVSKQLAILSVVAILQN